MNEAVTRAPGITPRSPRFDFDAVPRHWFAGIPLATQLANGVNLLFPAGERFFVRSVRHYLDRIDDETLRAEVKAFFAQEGQHANAHERYFRALEAQGYEVGRFMKVYQALAYDGLEQISPPALRLAGTAALEHFTAILAENALRERLLDHAHPAMRALMLWHAAEEIEHKSVAFDVLKTVAPSYALRMAGLALAVVTLGGFWVAGTSMLLWQDHRRGATDLFGGEKMRAMQPRDSLAKRVFMRGIREYMRRDFHPSQNDNGPLATAYLAEAGLG